MTIFSTEMKVAAQKSSALMLSLAAMMTICFAPALAHNGEQQKDSIYDKHTPHKPVATSYLA